MRFRTLAALTLPALAVVAVAVTPAGASPSFTASAAPAVGVPVILDATALCPVAACSYQWSDQWYDAVHSAWHPIATLGYTAQVAWTPGSEDAAHQAVAISVKVGIPQGRRVQAFVYQASFVVAVAP